MPLPSANITNETLEIHITNETLEILNVNENSARVLWLFQNSHGHCYISGGTGTGKTLVARALANAMPARYIDCQQMSAHDWELNYQEIFTLILNSKERAVIIDGFIPPRANTDYETLLKAISKANIRLVLFSQESPLNGAPAFSSRATLTFGKAENRYPVQFTDITNLFI